MIPLRNSLPYDIVMNEVYAQQCPFCDRSHVLLPLKPEDVTDMYGGRRKIMLVFPCCHGSVRLVDADSDYLLANRPIRR
ncbi:hypothetical protein D7Z26_05530 [Cohnella endophytica]|uniref:Uncharacterized protein n=1 Tax=Cohnella endophytica TaxID=2419778 RepID=A0A494Y1J1_9BACL|nr:hypothetical protein [Cohnella endophytica]RKP56111.1 hypothetical protein D7Z26_05530 [Cohnella endophytica]